MTGERSALPKGTTVEFDNGDIYRITGDPIGCGGGSILYPAQKQFLHNGLLQTDGIPYALKECFPTSLYRSYERNAQGEIRPCGSAQEDMLYLHRCQLRQLNEKTDTQKIYRSASRMIPIRESSSSVTLTLPGKNAVTVRNTVTVMDSLSQKGQSLTAWIKKQRRFAAAEALRIIQQVLFALEEIHRAGYLHLDIQDGNVFFRGTLEQKNELATLIDFGCARELADGKTAPIRDKLIFTTQGFSPPEILLRNDGNLQLGPEADIYSVGCLLLYLLTGQRANVRELMENRTGTYLRPAQLRRMKCPPHLTDTLQKLLSRSLEREPENRYASAAEMLADVGILLDALQPHRTELSAVKYDAFVCYKHGPVDTVAAATLQRALENYRAPRGVTQTGKPFRRVFVDEGELSSCADFGRQIRDALKNSQWLIVICSEETPSSPWVQLEIDTFLEYHDRSRILAVLTGGTPETSFPPQLRGETGGTEVFAAHAVSGTPKEAAKQLKRDALLKIAAPMLHTTFDTLKQRQKIYTLQRIAAVTAFFLAAAVGFAAYAVNRAEVISRQARRIEEEYSRALVNESLFLVEQAEKKLADNDPLGAMELALQALPSQQQDRPVLTQATCVLGKALGIYKTPSVTEDTAAAVGRILTDCPYFFLNEDGTKLFAWDDSSAAGTESKIQCWNTEQLSLVWEFSLDHGIAAEPLLSSDGRLYVMGYHQVHCFRAASGEEIWSADIPYTKTLSVSEDAGELLVLSAQSPYENTKITMTSTVLSSGTGEELRKIQFSLDEGIEPGGSICISPDLRFAAVAAVNGSEEGSVYHSYDSLYLADLETGACRRLLDSRTEIGCMLFTENSLALIRGSGYTLTTQHNTLYEYTGLYTYRLESYSLNNHELLWQQEITDYFSVGGICEILRTDYDSGTGTGQGLLFVFDDHCVLLDRETGISIRQYKLPAAAVTLSLTDMGFETVNTDGSCTASGFSTDTLMNIAYFSPVISEARRNGDSFFIQNETLLNRDHTIRKYRLNGFDTSYEPLFTADSNSWRVYGNHILADPDKVLLTNRNRLCLADVKTGQTWQCTVGESCGFSEYTVTGTSADGMRLYWQENGHWDDPACWINNSNFYCLDFSTGQITLLPQPPKPCEQITVQDIVFRDDSALFAASLYTDTEETVCIYRWDLITGALTELWQHTLSSAPEGAEGYEKYLWESYLRNSLFDCPETGQLSFALYENHSEVLTKLVCLNTETGNVTEISPRIAPEDGKNARQSWQKGCCRWNTDGTQAILAYGSSILTVDEQGNILGRISVTEPVVSLQYTPDGRSILAVSQSGVLSRYRPEDSRCLGSIDLAKYCSSLYTVYADNWTWEFTDDKTLLAVSNFGGFLTDLSGDSITMKATVSQCIGYDPAGDRFLVAETDSYSGKPTTIGCFRQYTVEDLIQKANTVMNP